MFQTIDPRGLTISLPAKPPPQDGRWSQEDYRQDGGVFQDPGRIHDGHEDARAWQEAPGV